MSALTRRVALLALALAGLTFASPGAAAAPAPRPDGRLVTPRGFTVPVHGTLVSGAAAADGHLTTTCARLSEAQIDSFYHRGEVARATLDTSRRVVVHAAGIAFTIVYSDAEGVGFNDPEQGAVRRAAMEATLQSWSNALGGTVPVVVEASMPSLPDEPNVLASASPSDFVVHEGRILPFSLAAQVLNTTVNGGSDLRIRFNAIHAWDYDPSGNAAPGKVNFIYTALHEVAHGLGFLSTFSPENGQLLAGLPTPFDTLINRSTADGNRLVARTPDAVLADVRSGDLYFAGPAAIQAGLASVRPLPMVKLYAPAEWEGGSSVSHVDQETYSDPSVGLMRPGDVGGAATSVVDSLTTAMMIDLGYTSAAAPAAAPGRR